MGKAGPEVASGINRVTGCPSEGKPNPPNQSSHQVRTETRHRSRDSNSLRKNSADHKHQNKSADDLANQVCAKSADRGRGAETGELQALVRSLLPVWQEVKPDESCFYESARHLRNQIWDKLGKLTRRNGKAHRHRGVEMSVAAPASDCREHACHNSERPTARNDHPAGTFSFRALEQHIRDHSVAQQYQYERTHELTKTLHKHVRTPFPIKTF